MVFLPISVSCLKAMVQRPANFVSFCIDELKELERISDSPQGPSTRDLPPVRDSHAKTAAF